MSFRISVFNSKELQATILALKGMDRELAKYIRAETKKMAQPAWQEEVRGRATTRLQVRVLSDTARVAVSNQNVTLTSGTVGKSLAGGYKPSDLVHGVEFGADRSYANPGYLSRRKGTIFNVKNRHTQRQFPAGNPTGTVVYPAAAKFIPRAASLWVQTTIKTFFDLLEGTS